MFIFKQVKVTLAITAPIFTVCLVVIIFVSNKIKLMKYILFACCRMLAEKLNMNPEDAECWIVNLIRNARLDAKIDSKLGHVVMGAQPLSPYQQLLEKIDSLSVRSEALQSLIERKIKARTQDVSMDLILKGQLLLESILF